MKNVITLFRGENCYFTINQDSEVISSLCIVNSFSVNGTKYSAFLDVELDQKLQKLISNGYRVKIRDAE